MPVAGSIKILKFGGTSVGAPERLRRVAEIVQRAAGTHRVVVVASALAGVTDALVAALASLQEADFSVPSYLESLSLRHRVLAAEVLSDAGQRHVEVLLNDQLERLEAALAEAQAEGCTASLRDEVLAAGERMAVPLVAGVLGEANLPAEAVDAAHLIRTDAIHGDAIVDLKETFRQVQAWYAAQTPPVLPVVTGFIGATPGGVTTTLGRGGSDYSAALLASALGASVLERWTDVDGIYTDDPRKNKDAQRLAYLVLEEAWAWNHAGRLGMHRKALDPLVAAGIPVHVRSTAEPDLPGTVIFPSRREQAACA